MIPELERAKVEASLKVSDPKGMNILTKLISLLLLGAMMLANGCKTKMWTSDEFEGVWRLESGSSALSKTTANAAMFTLVHDGRFLASALPPGFVQLDDVKPDQVLSGSGMWSLTRQDRDHEVRLRLTFIKVDGSKGQNLPYGAELFIQPAGGDSRLFYFIGDPDENQRITFRRESPRG